MGKKIFKPPAMESIISEGHAGSAFFSSKTFIQRGLLVGGDCEDVYRSLICFDISSLPLFLIIIKSTLNLFLCADEFPKCNKKAIEILQIVSKWHQERVCWKKQPLTKDIPAVTSKITAPTGTFVTWNITPLVEEWYTGQAANLGVMLKMSKECDRSLVAFASGKLPDSQVWPYLEIDYISPCHKKGDETLDITLHVTTCDALRFTQPINTLMFNYSYLIINDGPNAALVRLEVSPDGSVWQPQTLLTKVIPGQLVTLIPDTIAKFSRLAYQSLVPGDKTTLTINIQGIS